MKRKSTATDHAATKAKSAKRGRASGTATEPAIAKARDLAKFFLWDADFQTYNEERMTAHDPKAYKWSTGKKLFDYTPHVTKEDWLNALAHERYRVLVQNGNLRQRYGKDAALSKSCGRQDAFFFR